MNRQEIKDILQLCRPGHIEEDLKDPLIKEAFEQLEYDSELCAWFEEQQMVDTAICEALERIVPPLHLKTSILSGMQEHTAIADKSQENVLEKQALSDEAIAPHPSPIESESNIVWLRPFIGIAAVLLFASVLLVFSRKESQLQIANDSLTASETTAGVPDIIQFLSQQIADFNSSKFDKRSEQINELQSYLALYEMPNPSEIPQRLETAPTIGCVTFAYGETQMSMICFKDGQVYHLITVNKADLYENNMLDYPPTKPKVFEHRNQAFKVWSKDDQMYILSVEGTENDLPEFI